MISVVAGIIENNHGEVLLAERPQGKHLAGYWEFPGGKVEAGENDSTALLRELHEELELDVRIVEDLGIFTHNYPEQGEVALHVFRVLALSEPKKTRAVSNFAWFQIQDLLSQSLAPADLEPLRNYLHRFSPPSDH